MAVANPVLTWVASINTGTACTQSVAITATICLTAGFETLVPLAMQFTQVSADPLIDVYRSNDGGSTFETQPFLSTALARIATSKAKVCLRLATGIYAIKMLNSGPYTQTWFVETQEVLTAYASA